MNIGRGHDEPTFPRLAAHASQRVCVPPILWHPVRVVELVDTLRCERRAFGRAGFESRRAHGATYDVAKRWWEIYF